MAVLGNPSRSEATVATIEPPVFSTAPTTPDGESEGRATAPADKTLYITVPKLGVYGHTVRNDNSPAALDRGAIKLPSTGFPWQEGANTYIAGHRVGYRDTESYYQFYDLPSMSKGDEVILEDSGGRQYVYKVTKVFAVTPQETWVTAPVPGKDLVTLQTCTETVDDWQTISSNLMSSSPDTGRLIVRAERTL
jgi:sortase A